MAKLVYIRHGQTIDNFSRKISGSSDPELTEEGINQAHQAGDLLSQQYSNNIDFMVVSNMTRTNQTANILNQYLNINRVSYDNGLQEKGYGEFEGRFTEEVLSLIQAFKEDEAAPGGETARMFEQRVMNAICKYLQTEENSVGLIVAHGHVGNVLTASLLGIKKHFNNCEHIVIDPEEISDFSGKCGIKSSFDESGEF